MGRQLRAIALLPGLGTVVLPGLILVLTDFEIGWGLDSPLAAIPVLAGAALIAIGLTLMYRTISLFAGAGDGTLAPWDATRKLVVRGPYRYVRNPMITGVLCVLLGEAAVFGSIGILVWAALFGAINAMWFPLVEEPGLRQRFGDEYEVYRRHVPRWIPRRSPWHTDEP